MIRIISDYMDFSKVLKDCTTVWFYIFLSLEVFLFRKASYDPLIKYSNFCETSQWIIKDVVTCHIVQLSLCIISRNHTRIKPTIDKMHMLANDENSVRRNSTYSSIVTMTQQFKFKFAKAGLPERRGVGGGGRLSRIN